MSTVLSMANRFEHRNVAHERRALREKAGRRVFRTVAEVDAELASSLPNALTQEAVNARGGCHFFRKNEINGGLTRGAHSGPPRAGNFFEVNAPLMGFQSAGVVINPEDSRLSVRGERRTPTSSPFGSTIGLTITSNLELTSHFPAIKSGEVQFGDELVNQHHQDLQVLVDGNGRSVGPIRRLFDINRSKFIHGGIAAVQDPREHKTMFQFKNVEPSFAVGTLEDIVDASGKVLLSADLQQAELDHLASLIDNPEDQRAFQKPGASRAVPRTPWIACVVEGENGLELDYTIDVPGPAVKRGQKASPTIPIATPRRTMDGEHAQKYLITPGWVAQSTGLAASEWTEMKYVLDTIVIRGVLSDELWAEVTRERVNGVSGVKRALTDEIKKETEASTSSSPSPEKKIKVEMGSFI